MYFRNGRSVFQGRAVQYLLWPSHVMWRSAGSGAGAISSSYNPVPFATFVRFPQRRRFSISSLLTNCIASPHGKHSQTSPGLLIWDADFFRSSFGDNFFSFQSKLRKEIFVNISQLFLAAKVWRINPGAAPVFPIEKGDWPGGAICRDGKCSVVPCGRHRIHSLCFCCCCSCCCCYDQDRECQKQHRPYLQYNQNLCLCQRRWPDLS